MQVQYPHQGLFLNIHVYSLRKHNNKNRGNCPCHSRNWFDPQPSSFAECCTHCHFCFHFPCWWKWGFHISSYQKNNHLLENLWRKTQFFKGYQLFPSFSNTQTHVGRERRILLCAEANSFRHAHHSVKPSGFPTIRVICSTATVPVRESDVQPEVNWTIILPCRVSIMTSVINESRKRHFKAL